METPTLAGRDKRWSVAGMGVAAVVALATSTLLGQTPTIQCERVAQRGSLVQPEAEWWDKLPVTEVGMLPQTVSAPTNPQAAVQKLRVRAAHNGEWVAFQIQWEDATQSDVIVADRLGDQVAVELPNQFQEDVLPSPMMRNPGARVTIMQWRAAFQRDLDCGEPDVRDLYPFAWVDV